MINIKEIYEIQNSLISKVSVSDLVLQYYNKTQVDQRIADLVGSSPESLDTLNELAQALGNDPNFATTILNKIAEKANLKHEHNKAEIKDFPTSLPANGGDAATLCGYRPDDFLAKTGGIIEGNLRAKGAIYTEKQLQIEAKEGMGVGNFTSYFKNTNGEKEYCFDNVKDIKLNDFYMYHQGRKPLASDVVFNDGETFEGKLQAGKLKGDKGDKGNDGNPLQIENSFIGGTNKALSAERGKETHEAFLNETTRVNTELDKKSNIDHTHNIVTTSKEGFMSKEDKVKLNGIPSNANNYVHPNDSNNRHVTDSEKSSWNGKANSNHAHSDLSNRISSLEDKTPVWADVVGTGNIIANGTFEGTAKNTIIKGKTKRFQEAEYVTGINSVSFNDGIEGFTKDMIIKGKTSYIQTAKSASENGGHVKVEGEIIDGVTKELSIKGRTLQNLCDYTKLNARKIVLSLCKPNTMYTLIRGANDRRAGIWQGSSQLMAYTESKIYKFTTKISNESVELWFYDEGSPTLETENAKCLVLEGDWTNKPIPSYFEGIKSTGEIDKRAILLNENGEQSDNIVSSGQAEGNKIIVKSTGKNLINVPNSEWDVLKGVTDTTVMIDRLIKKNIPINPNLTTSISFKTNSTAPMRVFQHNKPIPDNYTTHNATYGWVTANGGKETSRTILNPGYKYITVSTGGSIPIGNLKPGDKVYFNDVMLEEGTLATNHEEYKVDKKEILLPMANGLKEFSSIDLENGIVSEGMLKYNITGDEVMSMVSPQSQGTTAYFQVKIQNIDDNGKLEGRVICNTFSMNTIWNTDNEGVKVEGSSERKNILRFRILKSKLDTPNEVGFKKWLKANPTIVYYELETPIAHNIEKVSLNTFKNVTHFSCESEIAPSNMEVYYPIKERESDVWTKYNRIESTGDAEANKISILSTGKNLCPIKSHTWDKSSNNQRIISVKKYLKSGDYAFLRNDNRIKIYYVAEDGTASYANPNGIVTLTKPCVEFRIYIDFEIFESGVVVKGDNFQIEPGIATTPYEDYICDKKEILLPFEGGLKEKDIVKDETSQIIEGSGVYTFSGNESFIQGAETNNDYIEVLFTAGNTKRCIPMCNMLVGTLEKIPNSEYCRCTEHYLILVVKKERLETPDLNGLKKWLQSNPTTVVYELATPIIHNIEKTVINTYNNTTHITVENNIPCSELKVAYPIVKTEVNEYKNKFDNIVSSGQAEGNKIVVKSTGKNLFDPRSTQFDYNEATKELVINASWVESNTNVNNINSPIAISYDYKASSDSSETASYFCIEYVDGTIENLYQVKTTQWKTIKIRSKAKPIKSILLKSTSLAYTTWMRNIQIELSTIATEYEPYVEDKKEILLPAEVVGGHKGLENIQSEYNSESGKYVEKVGMVVLDGSRDYRIVGIANDNALSFRVIIDNVKHVSGNFKSNLICSNMKVITPKEAWDKTDIGIATGTGVGEGLTISIEKSKLDTQDVAGFKKWLQANPTTVIYELAEPVIHNIEKNTISTYHSVTNITQENDICGEMSITLAKDRDAAINELSKRVTKSENDISSNKLLINENIDSINNLNFKVNQLEDKNIPYQEKTGDGYIKWTNSYVDNIKGLIIKGKTIIKSNNILETETTTTTERTTRVKIVENLKANTRYIFTADVIITENHTLKMASLFTDNTEGDWVILTNTNKINCTFTPTKDVKELILYFEESEFVSGVTAALSNSKLYEPGQSDSIVSSGEAEGNKIIVKSCGKNLINTFIRGLEDKGSSSIKNFENFITTRINVKENTSYRIQFNAVKDCRIYMFPKDRDGKGVGAFYHGDQLINTGKTVTTPTGTRYIALSFADDAELANSLEERIKMFSAMLELGTIATEYEDYKEDKKEISLPFEGGLNGLATVQDELKLEEGRIVQKTKKIVLNGSENWLYSTNGAVTYRCYVGLQNTTGKGICDKFAIESSSGTDKEVMFISKTDDTLYLRIDKSKLETPDVAGFKKWLQANPTTVVYELKEPIVHNIEKMEHLKSYKDVTYIATDNEIKGNLTASVRVDITKEAIRLENENLELKKDNQTLRSDLDNRSLFLNKQDIKLASSDLELDFRLMELEIVLDIPININNKKEVKNMAARTPYEMMKIVILGGEYDRADYEYKISVYVKRGRMTQAEADELISLMDANEIA